MLKYNNTKHKNNTMSKPKLTDPNKFPNTQTRNYKKKRTVTAKMFLYVKNNHLQVVHTCYIKSFSTNCVFRHFRHIFSNQVLNSLLISSAFKTVLIDKELFN